MVAGKGHIFRRMPSWATSKPFMLLMVLCLADASAIGTLVKGQKKKADTIKHITTAQAKYEKVDTDFDTFLDGIQDQTRAKIKEILKLEERGALGGGAGK